MNGTLIERYAGEIDGILPCYDRIILTGTLAGVCYPQGMTNYLYANNIRIFDYSDKMNSLRLDLIKNAKQIALDNHIEIEFIRNIKAFRKEKRIKEIIALRGEQPGLVHIFSAMESCRTFESWHDKKEHKTYLRNTGGKCLHYYFYFIDKEFGLCYMRVQTWAPFRLQFYCNGHSYLAQKLKKEGVEFTKLENCFSFIADWERACDLAASMPLDRLHRHCDRLAKMICPVTDTFKTIYHWSIMQCEYSTDLVFNNQATLQILYEALSRAAVCAIKAPDVAMFLGRKLDNHFQGELGSSFNTRVEGTCIKHFMGPAAVKLYDKQGLVLRIETTINDVTFFKHYRMVEHRDGTRENKFAPVRKSLYSLAPLQEIMTAVNNRYLKFISELADPSGGVKRLKKISQTVKVNGKGFGGFNLFHNDDLTLFQILARGENNIAGINNKRIREMIGDWKSARVSRLLKRLRLHGIIKRAGKTYHYYLTELGRRSVLTALKLRELVVIPALANVM